MEVIVTASAPELEKAKAFGYKVATLLAGWFALLFVVELLLRVVLWLIRVAVVAIMGKGKSASVDNSSSSKEESEKIQAE